MSLRSKKYFLFPFRALFRYAILLKKLFFSFFKKFIQFKILIFPRFYMPSYSSENSVWTPTPKIIKWLMILHLTMGSLSGFFNSLLGQKLQISFLKLFALSFQGLMKGQLWQLFSFIFIPEIEGSLNFYFLFTLCFDTYLLWLMGCRVQNQVGNKTFLKIFFYPAIFSSLSVIGISKWLHFPTPPLYGLSYGILSLVVAYCFINPQGQFNFFLPYPVRLRWVGLALTALYLLQDLSNLHFTALATHLSLLLMAHLYLVLFLRKKSPFSFTHKFDEFLISLRPKITSSKITPLYQHQKKMASFNAFLKKLKGALFSWKEALQKAKEKWSRNKEV